MMEGPSQDSLAQRRLLALARDFLQASDLETVLELAGRAIPKLLRADASLLLVVSGGSEYITEFGFERNGRPRAAGEPRLLQHARRAMADRTPILLPEIAADSALADGGLPSIGVASLLAYPFPPLAPVGALVAAWCRKGQRRELAARIPIVRQLGQLTGAALGSVGYRQRLEERLAAQADSIAAAARAHEVELLRRSAVEEELHRISVTDMMTGLLNRRGFFLHAERIFKVARRQRLPSQIVFVDIDGLKAINDAHGHEAGDDLIEDTALILQHSFRDADVVGRIGGDEFAAFTLDASQPDAVLSRLHASLANFVSRPEAPYRISFSTGIVRCDPTSELTLSDYLQQADTLMYEQKHRLPEED